MRNFIYYVKPYHLYQSIDSDSSVVHSTMKLVSRWSHKYINKGKVTIQKKKKKLGKHKLEVKIFIIEH